MATQPKLLKGDSWLEQASSIVHSGGVVALPFERLFGLAANAFSAESLERIQLIKKRPNKGAPPQPISVIVPDIEHILLVADGFPDAAKDLAIRFWPGPLTILVKAKPSLPPPLVGPGGLVGVRLAGPCPANELAKHTKLLLTATSANVSGSKDALSHREVVTLEGLDAVVEGEVTGPPGSTIVDCSDSNTKVLRQGWVQL